MRKHIKKLHEHFKKPAQTHHYVAFIMIIACFALLCIGAFATYASDAKICDSTLTDCSSTPIVDETAINVADYTDEEFAKALVKLKVNTLPVYQKTYGKNSKEVRTLKKLMKKLAVLHADKVKKNTSGLTGEVLLPAATKNTLKVKSKIEQPTVCLSLEGVKIKCPSDGSSDKTSVRPKTKKAILPKKTEPGECLSLEGVKAECPDDLSSDTVIRVKKPTSGQKTLPKQEIPTECLLLEGARIGCPKDKPVPAPSSQSKTGNSTECLSLEGVKTECPINPVQ